MTALIVILCIVVFFAFLLFMPIKLKAKYADDFVLKIGYLFLWFTLVPQKPKKKKAHKKSDKSPAEKKDKKEKKENENISQLKDIIKDKGIGGVIEILRQAINIMKGFLGGVTNHIIINRFNLSVIVATNDAADTAVNYGYACAGIYPLTSFILSAVKKIKTQSINVMPDFNKKECEITGDVYAKIKLFFLVGSLLKAGFRTLRLMINIKKGDTVAQEHAVK